MHYTNNLRKAWCHGSDSDGIKEFKGQAFFSAADLASTYGWNGYLYKVKINSRNPLVLVENPARMHKSVEGKELPGTDLELREFIKHELFRGCADDVLDGFDAKYAEFGPVVPTRLFGVASKGEEWEVIAENMERLGIDALLYTDESYERQFTGDACFVPESIGHVEILGMTKVDHGEYDPDFSAGTV
jgi:hypothetical protein